MRCCNLYRKVRETIVLPTHKTESFRPDSPGSLAQQATQTLRGWPRGSDWALVKNRRFLNQCRHLHRRRENVLIVFACATSRGRSSTAISLRSARAVVKSSVTSRLDRCSWPFLKGLQVWPTPQQTWEPHEPRNEPAFSPTRHLRSTASSYRLRSVIGTFETEQAPETRGELTVTCKFGWHGFAPFLRISLKVFLTLVKRASITLAPKAPAPKPWSVEKWLKRGKRRSKHP